MRAFLTTLLCLAVSGLIGCATPSGLSPSEDAGLADVREAASPQEDVPGTVNTALLTMTNAVSESYVIANGDEVEVEVLGEPEISRVFTVGASGEIRHPLLGAIRVGGMSAAQVEALLTQRLGADYLVDPRVYVRLKASAARRVMVFGEVRNPGVYHVGPDERFTLLGVLALAGGFTDIADVNDVRILRKNGDGDSEAAMRVRVQDVLAGSRKHHDVQLTAGDVINVPETLF